MLSEKDKEWIKEAVKEVLQEELKALVLREVIMEKGPRNQGDTDGVVKEKKIINTIDMIAHYLPFVEGALRGVQEDTNRTANAVSLQVLKIEGMGKTLISMQNVARVIGKLASAIDKANLLPKFKYPKIVGDEDLIEVEKEGSMLDEGSGK